MIYYIILGVLVLILVYVLYLYNLFTRMNNKVKDAFATMDVYLKKRWDLVPNLVDVVKEYAKHEKSTFESVIELRNKTYDNMSMSSKLNANENMSQELSKLVVLKEDYPDLKADSNFIDLAKQLSKLEEDIANSRKYYNAVVRDMNNKIQVFPNNIVAKILKFKSLKMFEANKDERNNVKVEL